jgi:hypothetical protein
MKTRASKRQGSCGGVIAGFARTVGLLALTVLPLGGLMLFLETTRPAERSSFAAVKSSSLIKVDYNDAVSFDRSKMVVRFKGISAELGPTMIVEPVGAKFTSKDAEHAIAAGRFANLNIGFQAEFITPDRHRYSLRIVGRDPIIDQQVPDNRTLSSITRASTANIVTFVWGDWLYRAEVQDKGFDPEIAVQKIL